MTDRATDLRTEADAIDAELAALDKTDREALLAFAVRQCSTLSEAMEPAEVEAMSTRDIRFHLEVEFDRWTEGLHNRAAYLEDAGEANPEPHNRDGFSESFYGPMSQPLLEAELKAEREAGPWYTVTVHGSPVEGSTDDQAEAQRWLTRANREDAFDGEATITTTDLPLAQ